MEGSPGYADATVLATLAAVGNHTLQVCMKLAQQWGQDSECWCRCSDEEYETDEEEEEGEEGAAEGGGAAAAPKPAASDDYDDDDDDDMPDLASGQFFCEEIRAIGLPEGPGVPTEVRSHSLDLRRYLRLCL